MKPDEFKQTPDGKLNDPFALPDEPQAVTKPPLELNF